MDALLTISKKILIPTVAATNIFFKNQIPPQLNIKEIYLSRVNHENEMKAGSNCRIIVAHGHKIVVVRESSSLFLRCDRLQLNISTLIVTRKWNSINISVY